ncbi:phosphotransferase enzyme family protein [Paenibacillus sp. J2TS4]|uniref:phosphotransferase enzyme family protein n=1 Tax=Paenibacillus sp. J2TS4 TaxID=2807194 RepID=UPI001B08C676|nr:aminoglycoside phosphotransferase family protein [Paenibacillus sp. J2TS4]GIP32210.1 hypothetical protein J2TS4_14200 [Paenibacillus sp. J2TS4]
MDNSVAILREAIEDYGLDPDKLIIVKKLSGHSHGDSHYQIRIQDKCYSARFISNKRYDHDVFIDLTDAVLEQQMKFIDFLNGHGIPFMRRFTTLTGHSFKKLNWNGTDYRFLLFEWIDGIHMTRCTEKIAYKSGVMARQYHNVSSKFNASLPKISHFEGSMKWLSMIKDTAGNASLAPENSAILQEYIQLAEHHIEAAYSSPANDFIMQSDLNPLNIVWDEGENIVGLVDFEHIGYTDRVEGLAWLIKWYSRPEGIASHSFSPHLAHSLLQGYGAEDFLRPEDWMRLPSLIWLTGCLNWGFVRATIQILQGGEKQPAFQLQQHLNKYRQRGEKLSSLVSK